MLMFRKLFVIAAVTLVVLLGCTEKNSLSSTSALDFSMQSLNGKTVKLSDFRGEPVLIDFWATWCPPCRESIPIIVRLNKTYGPKGLVVLGVSLDQGGWDSVQSFAKSHGITYPVLKASQAAIEMFGIRTIPTLVLINKKGEFVTRYIGVGDDGEIDQEIKALL